MAIFYGKNGVLRVYESTKGRDLSQSGPKRVHISNEVGGVHSDITANALNPSAGTNSILALSTDRVYIGQIFQFTKVTIDLSSLASADGGLLVVEYWNGSAWVAVPKLIDGTAVAANTMRIDGTIEFDLPTNWVKNDVPAAGTNLFYIRIHTTTSTATDAVAELIEPSSGQFLEVPFVNMDFSGPEGRNRPEEIPKLDRGVLNAQASYVQGLDMTIMEPLPVTFSCLMDSTTNAMALKKALSGEDPGITNTWPVATRSTKTDTKLPAGLDGALVFTPPFTDPTKKTVCLQVMWSVDLDVDPTKRAFREYNEVLCVGSDITIGEAADGVTITVNGHTYGGGPYTDLNRFGYRW